MKEICLCLPRLHTQVYWTQKPWFISFHKCCRSDMPFCCFSNSIGVGHNLPWQNGYAPPWRALGIDEQVEVIWSEGHGSLLRSHYGSWWRRNSRGDVWRWQRLFPAKMKPACGSFLLTSQGISERLLETLFPERRAFLHIGKCCNQPKLYCFLLKFFSKFYCFLEEKYPSPKTSSNTPAVYSHWVWVTVSKYETPGL